MTEQDKKRIGKFLSLALRHDPDKIGLELDGQSWFLLINHKKQLMAGRKYRAYISSQTLVEERKGHHFDALFICSEI